MESIKHSKHSVMGPDTKIMIKDNSSHGLTVGWKHADTLAPASTVDDFTKIPTVTLRPLSASEDIIPTNEPVNPKEVVSLLDNAYNNDGNVSSEDRKEVEAMIADVESGPDVLKKQMELLSKKIDEALQAETYDYERIHAMVLRFCMIHMRHVVKEDQEYIAKIGDQIKVQSGKIRESYNTWPVVTVTLISSAVSIVGGVGGFSTLIRPNSDVAKFLANNAHGISTMSTGISGAGSLLNSRTEGDRQVLQLVLRRDQDKEEEKKGSKNSTKESQKGFRNAIEEALRSWRDIIMSFLRG